LQSAAHNKKEKIMQNTKHTPAPWVSFKGYNETTFRAKGSTKGIGLVFHSGEKVDSYGECPRETKATPEDRANARLIAAAPELYDLLHVILMQHRTDGAYSSKGEVSLSRAMESRIEDTLSRAAIAKATGE
jgi:hypothetical protein